PTVSTVCAPRRSPDWAWCCMPNGSLRPVSSRCAIPSDCFPMRGRSSSCSWRVVPCSAVRRRPCGRPSSRMRIACACDGVADGYSSATPAGGGNVHAAGGTVSTDAIVLLKEDHKEIKKLFRDFRKAEGEKEKGKIVD